MKFIADLHIHSHYSIATSKELIPEYLDYWAKIKGITVVGTGDFTHPGWTDELKEKLVPAEPGLYKLRSDLSKDRELQSLIPEPPEVRFLLTAEISNIYKKNGKVRKVHNVLFAPDFYTVDKVQHELSRLKFNITSDGRPILGMDSKDLLELCLNVSEEIFFVPAHIWTPWFSVLGAKSGFDTVEECFEELSEHIYAVETGLSSNPPMNWMCSFLDKYVLMANSDAHSPEKLGRNANIFNTDLSYYSITEALKSGDPGKCLGTIDMFPQEGKYHYAGHRKCKVCLDPVETLKNRELCPVCGKKVTMGVMNRVTQLSDRDDVSEKPNQLPFYQLIPLKEILSEIHDVGPNTKKVTQVYNALIKKAGSEFNILHNDPLEEIRYEGYENIYEAVKRMRNGNIYIQEGYDGEYGRIKVFGENEQKDIKMQDSLFADTVQEDAVAGYHSAGYKPKRKLLNFDLAEYRRLERENNDANAQERDQQLPYAKEEKSRYGLNPEQSLAMQHFDGPAIIIAGPGTGKTHVIAYRIVNLIRSKGIKPGNILAVTFTNKAAGEMKERVESMLDKDIASEISISTFHALGYKILNEQEGAGTDKDMITVLSEDDRKQLLFAAGCDRTNISNVSATISFARQDLRSPQETASSDQQKICAEYERLLEEYGVYDMDDLIYRTVVLLKENKNVLDHYRNKYRWVMIDEFQDINYAQYELIRLFAPDMNANLCVIGDPNQAIYGFRGADVIFIRKFTQDFPDARIYKLKKSYRCTNNILKASGDVIYDKSQSDSFLEGMQDGVKINIMPYASDRSEAEDIARIIERLTGGLRFFSMDSDIVKGESEENAVSLSEIAVLCRVKDQMRVFEKAFNDHSIPYQTIGDDPFFRTDPVSTIIDIMKLIVDPGLSFIREKIEKKGVLQVGSRIDINADNKTVRGIIEEIAGRYFYGDKSVDPDIFRRMTVLADQYGKNVNEFLKYCSLGTGSDTYNNNIENVTLMTLHGSKGLEFEYVFIAGCENGLLPYSVFESQQSDTEEEKRLLYVGMTRAKKDLYLSYAKKRFLFGKEYDLDKSPFINSIEKELIREAKITYKKKKEKDKDQDQLSLF